MPRAAKSHQSDPTASISRAVKEVTMATTRMVNAGKLQQAKSVSLRRVALATGATAAAVFVLCWVGTFIAFASPTHAYIGLFTTADVSSVKALTEGTLWSLLFGAFLGAVFALIYNATAALAFDKEYAS